MVAEISPPLSVDNIQLKLKQKININGRNIRGCSLLPDGRMVLFLLFSGFLLQLMPSSDLLVTCPGDC
jgi:hypothetical protein